MTVLAGQVFAFFKTNLLRMKKFLLSLSVAAAAVVPSVAQLGGDGYYRVQNAITQRYIYITDNKGKIDVGTTSVDVLAIQLWKNADKAISDPATVLYIKKEPSSRNDYDITAQGTGIYQIISRYVTLLRNSDGTYMAYGRSSGAVKYLADAESSNKDEGAMSTEVRDDRRKWYIKPITTTGDNYFGVKPTVNAGGKYYMPFYASFPFSAHSSGVKVYTISECGYGMAVAEPVNGTVPAATPCYIECSSSAPASNRLNIGGSAQAISRNMLGGVYFENYLPTHLNLTRYDKNTMRVLGTLADGKLGFVTANIEYLPANQSYLKVPAGSPASIRIVTKAEYDAAVNALPKSVALDATSLKLYQGASKQLTATIDPVNASDKTLKWTSSNTAVATVNGSGVVTAAGKGSATVTVTTVNGKSASCAVTVAPKYPESVSLSATSLKMYAGDTAKLTATISPSDVEQTALTWSSSDASVVAVAADGTLSAVKAGNATVSVRAADGKTASCAVAVAHRYPTSVSLSRTSIFIHAGEKTTLTATISPTDVKDKSLTWTSSDPAVVAVDASGNVSALQVGDAVITVSSPGGASATCSVAVARALPSSVSVNIPTAVIEVGDKVTIRASVSPADAVSTVKWSSSDASIAKISGSGQFTAVAPGKAQIIATTENGLTAHCDVTVLEKGIPATAVTLDPSRLVLVNGESASVKATIEPADVSNKFIIWTSSNESVAKVDDKGNVTSVSPGVCNITAQCGQASTRLTVRVNEFVPVSSVTLDRTTVDAEEGDEFDLKATVAPSTASYKTLAWASNNEEVAVVDQNGHVRVLSFGVAVISATATDGSNVSGECRVSVKGFVPVSRIELNRTEFSIEEGNSFTLTATVFPEDATDKSISWRSSNENVATVDNGFVTVRKPGNAVITVQALDGSGVTATCSILGTAGAAIVLAPGETLPVYTVDGILLHANADAETIRSLAPGVYIVGNHNLLVK